MFGKRAYELFQEVATCPADGLPAFNVSAGACSSQGLGLSKVLKTGDPCCRRTCSRRCWTKSTFSTSGYQQFSSEGRLGPACTRPLQSLLYFEPERPLHLPPQQPSRLSTTCSCLCRAYASLQ